MRIALPPHVVALVKEPRSGRVKTRLARHLGSAAATRLHTAMLADTARTLRAFGPHTWWVEGKKEAVRSVVGEDAELRTQPSGDLGARLAAAFAAAFREHGGPVAAVGGDCPELSPADLGELFRAVNEGNGAAIIPAADGGFAALALSSPCPDAFEGVRWSTPDTLPDLVARLRATGIEPALLPGKADVDVAEDVEKLADRLHRGESPHLAATLAALAEMGLLRPLSAPRALPDDLARPVETEPLPRRMVSLVPSVTECLFDLGAGDRVVGCTDFCISPAAGVAPLTRVGGPKTVDVEKLLSLAPDLVWADAEENDRAQVEAIMAAGVRVFTALPRTLPDVASFLRRAARIVGLDPDAAEAQAVRLEALARRAPSTDLPALLLIWKSPWMSVSDDTLCAAILRAAGCRNVAGPSVARYPVVDPAALPRPGVVLLPSEPYPFSDGDAREAGAALPGAEVLRVPGEWVTWYGMRTADNVAGLRRALAPLRAPKPLEII